MFHEVKLRRYLRGIILTPHIAGARAGRGSRVAAPVATESWRLKLVSAAD